MGKAESGTNWGIRYLDVGMEGGEEEGEREACEYDGALNVKKRAAALLPFPASAACSMCYLLCLDKDVHADFSSSAMPRVHTTIAAILLSLCLLLHHLLGFRRLHWRSSVADGGGCCGCCCWLNVRGDGLRSLCRRRHGRGLGCLRSGLCVMGVCGVRSAAMRWISALEASLANEFAAESSSPSRHVRTSRPFQVVRLTRKDNTHPTDVEACSLHQRGALGLAFGHAKWHFLTSPPWWYSTIRPSLSALESHHHCRIGPRDAFANRKVPNKSYRPLFMCRLLH